MRMRGVLIGVAIGTTLAITASRVGRWRRTWGIDPAEATRALPGDDVVAEPTAVETRGITIDAPPEAVWPWLLQMGYGKAGWYSYDQLDQRGRSADEIVEAWGALKVGDIVPTHPDGGFEVAAIEPNRALVLRTDTALVTAQAEAAREKASGIETATAGVRLSGAMLSNTPQQYVASWAFVLEPLEGGRTRFIERFRVWFGEGQTGSQLVLPVVGFGVFVMMQKQMVGIRDRAERLARQTATQPPREVPATVPKTNGHGRRKHVGDTEVVAGPAG
jgi:hypothetical protein